jgi:hypothetical protein
MRKITIRHRVFWIGVLKSPNSDKQRLVIYDPCFQARAFSDEFIILFELDEMQPAEFYKETVRGLIGNPPQHADSVLQAALNGYLQANGIDVEGEWRELKGEQQRAGGHRYENQCWQGQRNVDDETLPRCSGGCGWVHCSCGSCLCDMPLQKRLERPHTVKIQYVTDAVSPCPACKGVCFTGSAAE